MMMRVVVVLMLFFLGCPSLLLADTVIIHNGTKDYRSLSLISYRGLPRLGAQAESVNAETIEQHNYALGLMVRLGFMNSANKCFSGMNGYQVRVEKCKGTLIDHGYQTKFWQSYVKNLACSLTPDAHLKSFCMAEGVYCSNVSVDQIKIKNKNNLRVPYRAPDEFEIRDNAARLMKQRHASFEAYRRGLRLPSEVYYVSRVRIGNYQFDQGRFVFSYHLPNSGSIASPNRGYRGPAVPRRPGGKMMRTRPLYSRSLQAMLFHDAGTNSGNPISQNQYHQRISLPMESSQARQLVSGNTNTRELYAVVKLRLMPWEIGSHQPLEQENRLNYRLAENRLELFRDSGLTQKVKTLTITEPSAGSRDLKQQGADEKQYQAPKGAALLDYRTMSLLRLKQGDLQKSAMERIAQSLPAAERSLWQRYQRRLESLKSANKSISKGGKNSPAAMRQLKDATRLSAVSWQSSGSLNSSQRQALFDYLMGIGADERGMPAWPKSLPSVEWGMNIATVFDRGHFSIARESQNVIADKSTQKQIRRFLKQAAESQSIRTLILSYPLDNLSYDQKKQAMTFTVKGPLYPVDPVSFATDENRVYRSQTERLVSAGARDRVIYQWQTSSRPVGDLVPNPPASGCLKNEKTRAVACTTGYSSFLNQQFYSAFLALDKKLPVPSHIKMRQERGNQYGYNIKSPGWRIIVELDYEKMDVVTFNYKERNKNGTSESQTLFGRVRSMKILDQNDGVVWSADAKKMTDAQKVTRLTELKKPVKARFPKQLVMSPFLHDFLLARYYPDQLNQRMLEAMLSSRWSYEHREKQPLGGRFFNQGGRTPGYQDIKGITGEFRKWLLSCAKALPEQLIIEMFLQYSQDTMRVSERCLRVVMPKGAPVRNPKTAKRLAANKVRDCENENRQLMNEFDQCEKLREDLAREQQKLAEAEANGCGQSSNDDTGEPVLETGPCNIPDNLTIADMQTEMMKCMTSTCGTPTATTDLQAYQKCVEAVSEQFGNKISALMGQAPRKKASRKEDTCRAAKRQIRLIQKRLEKPPCRSLTKEPQLADCTSKGVVNLPDEMLVERIDLSSIHRCFVRASVFDRKSNASAALLPNIRPYSDMHYDFVLSVDKLALPYNPPIPEKGPMTQVKARIKVAVKAADKSLNRPGQFGLAVEVRDLEFGQ